MNILFWGNQDNVGYRVAKMFRKSGYNCELYIDKYCNRERSLPELWDPDLKENYPDWIKVNNNFLFLRYLLPLDLIKKAKKYDVVITTGSSILSSWWFSDFYKIPVIFLPLGFDLREAPFIKTQIHSWYDRVIMRHSIRNMAGLFIHQTDSLEAAKKLNYNNKIKWIPIPDDIKALKKKISPNIVDPFLDYDEYDVVFFMPTRINLDETRVDYKGNEKVLKAYIKLKKETDKRIKIVFGKHGNDVDKFIKMVENINDDSIEFIDHTPAFEMHRIFTLPNVVVLDQFAQLKGMGAICKEALSLGSIVISKPVDIQNPTKNFFNSNPPIIEAQTTEEMYNAMKKIAEMDYKEKMKLSKQSERWAWENLDGNILIEKYLRYMNEIIKSDKYN